MSNEPKTEVDADEPPEHEPVSQPSGRKKAFAIRDLNKLIRGSLILQTATRDIELAVDGDVAMRVMTVFRDGSARRYWSDTSNPDDTLALDDLIAIDMSQIVLMSWRPDEYPAGHHSDAPRGAASRQPSTNAD